MTIDILLTRHGIKEAKKVVPGSDEDKNEVDLSQEGKVKCYESGLDVIRPYPFYSQVFVVTSDFLRVRRTAEKMLEAGHYDMSDSGLVTILKRSDISIGGGINWKAPELLPYSDEGEAADNFRKGLRKDFYKPHEGRQDLPVMSRFAYALFDSLICGIETEMKRIKEMKNRDTLLLVATHTPIIDAFGNSIYRSLVVDDNGDTSVENFPGFFRMGEFIQGSIHSLNDDPHIMLNVKGKEMDYKLSELKQMREMHKRFAYR